MMFGNRKLGRRKCNINPLELGLDSMTKKRPRKLKRTPGPEAERLALPGHWKDAVKAALKRGKPPKSEPTPPQKKRRSK
jgi:hypothetical protein